MNAEKFRVCLGPHAWKRTSQQYCTAQPKVQMMPLRSGRNHERLHDIPRTPVGRATIRSSPPRGRGGMLRIARPLGSPGRGLCGASQATGQHHKPPHVPHPRRPPQATDGSGSSHPLDASSRVLGRDPLTTDIVLPDASISRQHAAFVWHTDGRLFVIDLASVGRAGGEPRAQASSPPFLFRAGCRPSVWMLLFILTAHTHCAFFSPPRCLPAPR